MNQKKFKRKATARLGTAKRHFRNLFKKRYQAKTL